MKTDTLESVLLFLLNFKRHCLHTPKQRTIKLVKTTKKVNAFNYSTD